MICKIGHPIHAENREQSCCIIDLNFFGKTSRSSRCRIPLRSIIGIKFQYNKHNRIRVFTGPVSTRSLSQFAVTMTTAADASRSMLLRHATATLPVQRKAKAVGLRKSKRHRIYRMQNSCRLAYFFRLAARTDS